jgi:DNA-binding response OmpR family regulator
VSTHEAADSRAIDLRTHGSGWPEVLIVSHDDAWSALLADALTTESLLASVDPTGRQSLDRRRQPFDLVIFDLAVTYPSLRVVCDAVRSRRPIPVIAVDAVTGGSIVLTAYEAGADQFVPKSASPRVLAARVRALLRRVDGPSRQLLELRGAHAPIVLDPDTTRVWVAGIEVPMTDREFDVLHHLARRADRVVSRTELAAPNSPGQMDRSLDFVIRRLREKLEAVDGVRRIEVMRGVGFRLVVGDELIESPVGEPAT